MRGGAAEVAAVDEVGGGQHVQAGQHLAGRPRPGLDHRAEPGGDAQRALHQRIRRRSPARRSASGTSTPSRDADARAPRNADSVLTPADSRRSTLCRSSRSMPARAPSAASRTPGRSRSGASGSGAPGRLTGRAAPGRTGMVTATTVRGGRTGPQSPAAKVSRPRCVRCPAGGALAVAVAPTTTASPAAKPGDATADVSVREPRRPAAPAASADALGGVPDPVQKTHAGRFLRRARADADVGRGAPAVQRAVTLRLRQARTASRRWRRSCAASSISLCPHSAAR